MHFVPIEDRITSCSAVSRALEQAAAAATQQAQLTHERHGEWDHFTERIVVFFQWTSHHGQYLTSLRLSDIRLHRKTRPDTAQVLQLPCPNLLELELALVAVQLGPTSTHPGVLHTCTQLTKLRLRACPITDWPTGLAALSAAPQLQDLQLADIQPPAGAAAAVLDSDQYSLFSSVLQDLQGLKSLQLTDQQCWYLSADTLQHLSSLTNLQESRVTSDDVEFSSSTTPGISALTALTRIDLHEMSLDLAVLQHTTQLQHLSLSDVFIHNTDDPDDPTALLTYIGRLQQLQELWLYTFEYEWPAASAAYANLTASSNLRFSNGQQHGARRCVAALFPAKPPVPAPAGAQLLRPLEQRAPPSCSNWPRHVRHLPLD
jgi:hypothetical protein